MTGRKLIVSSLVFVAIGTVHYWTLYDRLSLDSKEVGFVTLSVCFLAIMMGWLLFGFWLTTPPSQMRWRRVMYGLFGIVSGTGGLTALGGLDAWTDRFLVGSFLIALLALLPIGGEKKNKS